MQNNKYSYLFSLLLAASFPCSALFSQTPVEGYVFESNNVGFIEHAGVTVYELNGKKAITTVYSDMFGHIAVELAPGKYRLSSHKDMFEDRQDTIQVKTTKLFLKLEMRRQPGYLFDANLLEAADSPSGKTGLTGSTIEIYNRTLDQVEAVLKMKTTTSFEQRFEQGMHYTILIRKPGYIGKRLEVYVNNNDCPLCIEGIPGFQTNGTVKMIGTNKVIPISADIILERPVVGKHLAVAEIDDKMIEEWRKKPGIIKSLEDVVILLRDNPDISAEIGFHTDSRGDDNYNLDVSQNHADAARAYIIGGGIESQRITAKGYGETQLLNKCANGVDCIEAEHRQNHRAELTITAVSVEPYGWLSIEQIVEEEKIAARTKEELKDTPKMQWPGGSKNKPQPEANNTVPLPEFKGNQKAENGAENAANSGAPARKFENIPHKNVNIGPLDGAYAGLAIQIFKSTEEMNALPKELRSFSEIYWSREADGAWYYYILPKGALSDVKKEYKKTIKPQHPDALLVRFGPKGKEYLK
jgi:hypothetical protein